MGADSEGGSSAELYAGKLDNRTRQPQSLAAYGTRQPRQPRQPFWQTFRKTKKCKNFICDFELKISETVATRQLQLFGMLALMERSQGRDASWKSVTTQGIEAIKTTSKTGNIMRSQLFSQITTRQWLKA